MAAAASDLPPATFLDLPIDVTALILQSAPVSTIGRVARVKCESRWSDIPPDLFFSQKWRAYYRRRHTVQTNVEAGRRTVRSLRGHASYIVALEELTASATALSVGADQTVRVWDVRTAAETQQFAIGLTPPVLRAHSSGLFATGADNHLQLYRLGVDKPVHRIARSVSTATWLDGSTLAVAHPQVQAALLDAATGALKPIAGPSAAVAAVQPSRGSALLAVGLGNGAVDMLDVRTGKPVCTLNALGGGPVREIVSDGDAVLYTDGSECGAHDLLKKSSINGSFSSVRGLQVCGDRAAWIDAGGVRVAAWRTGTSSLQAGAFNCVALDRVKFVTGGADNNVSVFSVSGPASQKILTMMGGSTVARGVVPNPSVPGISRVISHETHVLAVTGSVVKVFDFIPVTLDDE